MSTWGRNATADESASARRRYGFWSILLALTALVLVIASMILVVNVPEAVSKPVSNAASIVAVVAYFIAAPVLHAAGFAFGVAGLFRATHKGSSVVGVLLNLALFGAGVGIIYFTAGALTAFR